MEGLAIFVGGTIKAGIVGLALITIGGFAYVVYKIGKVNADINSNKKHKSRNEYTEGGVQRSASVVTWEETLDYLEKFNKIQLTYSIFEQFVPIFPLLGILGTVAGLIQQLGDPDNLRQALATSMDTTFYGLIAAIILRIIDAVFVSKSVNSMALYFETFEQNYYMVRDKHIEDSKGLQ